MAVNSPGSAPHLLLAGISPDTALQLRVILEPLGYALGHAGSVEEITRPVEREELDLLLLDTAAFSGAREILLEKCQNAGIPVIILCGPGSAERQEAFAPGVSEYILMPLVVEEVQARIGRTLSGRRESNRKRLVDNLGLNDPIFSSALMEHMQFFFVVISRDGILLWINPAMLKVTGYTADEVVGRDYMTTFVPDDDRYVLSNVFEEVTVDHHLTINENRIRSKDGTMLDVEWRGIPYASDTKCQYVVGIGSDVTERRKVQEALKISEQKYRSLVENVNIGVYRNTATGKGQWEQVNPAMAKIFGFDSVEELMKVNVEDVYETSTERAAYLDTIHASGYVANHELRLKKKDGTLIWGSITARAEFGEDGEIRWMDGVLEDINSRKETEAMLLRRTQELQESEEKYHALFDGSKDAMLVIDGNRFVECNQAAVEMLGYPGADELVGAHPAEISPPYQENGEPSWEESERILQTAVQEGSNRFEWIHRCYDGRDIWVDVTLTRIPYRDRLLIHTAWRDISERKAAERAVKELNDYLKNIINAMPSMLFGVGQDCTVTRWNRECEQRTGFSSDEAIGQSIDRLLPGITALPEEIALAINQQSVRRLGCWPVHDLSGQRYVEVVIYPLENVKSGGAVIRIDDITERMALEELVVQTEKMMTVGGLAAGMAHEINNPLSGILQAIQNIERRLAVEMPANQAAAIEQGTTIEAINAYMKQRQIMQFVDSVKKGGQKASVIISNMLQFSRASSSVKELVDLNELLDNAVLLAANDYDLQKGYDVRKVAFIRDYDLELPPVYCSIVEIEQVVVNLIKNSVQAMACSCDRPSISLKTVLNGDWIKIIVRDNGPGMEEAVRRRIFEPFFTTKSSGQGTGLGLSISYFIITNNHNGQMKVESFPGEGTVFTIFLPNQPAPASASAPAPY